MDIILCLVKKNFILLWKYKFFLIISAIFLISIPIVLYLQIRVTSNISENKELQNFINYSSIEKSFTLYQNESMTFNNDSFLELKNYYTNRNICINFFNMSNKSFINVKNNAKYFCSNETNNCNIFYQLC